MRQQTSNGHAGEIFSLGVGSLANIDRVLKFTYYNQMWGLSMVSHQSVVDNTQNNKGKIRITQKTNRNR